MLSITYLWRKIQNLQKQTNLYTENRRNEYYSKYAKGNIKSTWKILNAIINKKTNTCKLPSQFECNEINIVSKQSIADGFNNFFVGVGPNLDKKITVADNAASIYDYMGQQCPNSMFINPVSEDEV